MFKRGSYTATYDGPVLASGETLRRAASHTGANQSFQGDRRNFVLGGLMQGVGAGGKNARYRTGMASLAAQAQAPNYKSEYLSRLADNANAQLDYEQSTAEERDGLRRLRFDTDQTGIMANTALRGDRITREVGEAGRRANTQIGKENRKGTMLGFLGGLFG
jgi:hypothetical protein